MKSEKSTNLVKETTHTQVSMTENVTDPSTKSLHWSMLYALSSATYIIAGAITLEGTNAASDRGHVYYNGQPLCAES